MIAAGTVTDEDDSELRLEENSTDGPGLAQGRHDDGRRVEVDGRAPLLTHKRAAVPSIPEDDPLKSPVDSVSCGVVPALSAELNVGANSTTNVTTGSPCTGHRYGMYGCVFIPRKVL